MEVEIYNMDEFEGRLRYYKYKASQLGGKVRVRKGEVFYIEPTHEEIISILKKKIKKDKEGKLVDFGKRSRLSPYIEYPDRKESYYHRMYLF